MKITGLPKEFSETIAANEQLQRYLLGLTSGKPYTKRSWLFEWIENPNDILLSWKDVLKKLKSGTAFEQEVFQFDTSSEEKWGPQGGVAPVAELMKDVVEPTFSQVSSPIPRAFTDPDWEKAKEVVSRRMAKRGVRGLRPASYSTVVDDMRARDTLESNSGWPDFKRRNFPEVKQRAVTDALDGMWETYPAIALFRNYRQKTRLVWMFPMSTNIVEGSFYQPLQSSLVNSKPVFYAPWVGFDAVRVVISDAYKKGLYVYASDFSATDAHFVPRASFEVFDVLKRCFASGSSVTGLRRSLSRMHKIPLIVGPDQMVSGDHGVASGSEWTNFIESIFDEIFGVYVSIKLGDVKGLYAIGDDMTWVSQQFSEDFKTSLEKLGREVGQDVQAKKTVADRDKVKTLQRLFIRGYSRPSDGLLRGVYPTIRALNSLVFPERMHKKRDWSEDMFCARCFMILENCVDHPLFEDFVQFVLRGNHHLGPFARKTRRELNEITRKSKLVPGLNPTYNQERRDSSLADFASIQVAKNL
nr:RNA-dependent RNA polymerase [Marmot picobirnavirus]